MAKGMMKWRKLPVYQKAEEMLDLVDIIAESLKDDDMKKGLAEQMCSNAMIIQAKIAGASGCGLYSLQMENAVVIKIAVRDMFNAVIFASMVKINNKDYEQLMREKVEEFRVLFVEWIRGFNKAQDIPDNWAIRYDTSTPEQEKLEELMFDDDAFDDWLDEEYGDNDEEDE